MSKYTSTLVTIMISIGFCLLVIGGIVLINHDKYPQTKPASEQPQNNTSTALFPTPVITVFNSTPSKSAVPVNNTSSYNVATNTSAPNVSTNISSNSLMNNTSNRVLPNNSNSGKNEEIINSAGKEIIRKIEDSEIYKKLEKPIPNMLYVRNNNSGSSYYLKAQVEADGDGFTLRRLYFPSGGSTGFIGCDLDKDFEGFCLDRNGNGWTILGE